MKSLLFLVTLISFCACDSLMVQVSNPPTSNADATQDSSKNEPETNVQQKPPTPIPSNPSKSEVPCEWTLLYEDKDQDGYGNDTVAIKHCTNDPIGDGWSKKGGDCDDANFSKNISCSVKTKPTSCPNNCSDENPYTWGYCTQENSFWCDGNEAWIRIQCTLPNETIISPPQPLWFGCMPVAWIMIPNQTVEMNLGQSLIISQNGSSQIYLEDLKTVCESLAQPGAVMHVNAIALDKNNKQISSIGGTNVKASDSFWWASKHSPFQGKTGVPTIFEQMDYLYFFNDFPLCIKAKQEVEANGGVYPPPD